MARTWCTPCHSSQLPAEERQGAPAGIDFDTWQAAVLWIDALPLTLAPGAERMPPSGGMPWADRDQLLAWAECGGPGAPDPSDPCQDPTQVPGGPLSVDLCREQAGLSILGDATLEAPGAWDCVCAVEGHLQIEAAGAVHLGRLEQVGGDLRVGGSTSEVYVSSLREVRGSLLLSQSTSLIATDFGALTSVGRDLHLEGAKSLLAFEPLRLAHLGGDLRLVDLNLRDLDGFASLEVVGGELRIERSRTPQLRGFPRLRSVGADLVVRDDPGTQLLDAFPLLETVGGDLRLEAEPRLLLVSGMSALRRVGGSLLLADLVELREVQDLSSLESVASLVVEDAPLLFSAPLPALREAQQGARFDRTGLRSLLLPTLDNPGGLQVTEAPALATLDLAALTQIEGDLTLLDLPSLPTEVVDDLLGRVRVTGEVVRD